jgi:palmitoyltransferase ZDHHC13/17
MPFQDNARRVYERRCDGGTPIGKIGKLGLAPLLWTIILGLLFMYIYSVIPGASFFFYEQIYSMKHVFP